MKPDMPLVRRLIIVFLFFSIMVAVVTPITPSDVLWLVEKVYAYAQRFFFFGIIALVGLYCFINPGSFQKLRGSPKFGEARRSRHACQSAYEALRQHIRMRGRDGAEAKEFERLRGNLVAMLRKHDLFYPKECDRQDILLYKQYSNEVGGSRLGLESYL